MKLQVFKNRIANLKTKVRLPKVAPGIYTYKCEFENCEHQVGKIQIIE
jgi:hypothetical protein